MAFGVALYGVSVSVSAWDARAVTVLDGGAVPPELAVETGGNNSGSFG